jgi:quinone-modifying oxidoreductase subunit QmoA
MMSGNGKKGKVLVVGGGISGITAAVEASEAGADVVLVEREPYLGGRVVQLNQYFPKMCPPNCGLEINLRRFKTNPRIQCLTLSEVQSIAGVSGNYKVTVRQRPRFVNSKCTICGACVDACPVERANEFDFGMGTTKAIYLPHEMAYPMRFAIDGSVCPGEQCGKCVPACPYDAIELGQQESTVELEVQSVIWATGWDPFDAAKLIDLGYGKYANVVTNMMMERLSALNGPTGGKIQRPSDGEGVTSIAFVQCAGSRDENHLKHCSGVCCLASLKQARYVREQYPDAQIYIFYIDIRAPGRLEDFYQATETDEKLTLIKGKVAKVTEDSTSKSLVVEAENTLSGERMILAVDMVVLATGMVPNGCGSTQVGGGVSTDPDGFLQAEQSSDGLLVAGCAKRPTDVATCVRDATGAAGKALHFIGGQSGG